MELPPPPARGPPMNPPEASRLSSSSGKGTPAKKPQNTHPKGRARPLSDTPKDGIPTRKKRRTQGTNDPHLKHQTPTQIAQAWERALNTPLLELPHLQDVRRSSMDHGVGERKRNTAPLHVQEADLSYAQILEEAASTTRRRSTGTGAGPRKSRGASGDERRRGRGTSAAAAATTTNHHSETQARSRRSAVSGRSSSTSSSSSTSTSGAASSSSSARCTAARAAAAPSAKTPAQKTCSSSQHLRVACWAPTSTTDSSSSSSSNA